MGRPIDPQKLSDIQEAIKSYHLENTASEIARMVNVSASSIRHHGKQIKLHFKKKHWSTKKIVKPDGQYFNVYQRENWLV